MKIETDMTNTTNNAAWLAVRELLAVREAAAGQVAALSKQMTDAAQELTEIEATGDLLDDQVIARHASLKAGVPLWQNRIAMHNGYLQSTAEELVGKTSQFVRHILSPAIEALLRQARDKVSAKLKGQFNQPELLGQAVEGAELVQQVWALKNAAEIKWPVHFNQGSQGFSYHGIHHYAKANLANWEAVKAFAV